MLLNVARIGEGNVLRQMRAMIYAFGDDNLPIALFEGIALSAKEAKDMAFEANVARATARTVRKMSGR